MYYLFFLMLNKLLQSVSIIFFFTAFFLEIYLIRFSFLFVLTNLQELILFIGNLFLLIFIIKSSKFNFFFKKILNNRYIIIILFLIFVSIFKLFLNNGVNYVDFIRHLRFLTGGLMFYGLWSFMADNIKKSWLAMDIMGYGAIFFGIFSFFYNFLGFNMSFDNRLTGPLDSAVYLAFYLTPFLIYFGLKFWDKKRYLDLVNAIILLVLILLTKSMAAIFFAFLVFFVSGILRLRREVFSKLNLIVISTITVLLMISGFFFFKERISNSFNAESSSLLERIEIWRTSKYLISDPLNLIFGVGLGQFQYQYENNVETALYGKQPLDFVVLQPHNIFYLFWFQFGIFGLIFAIYIFIKLIRDLFYFSGEKLNLYYFFTFILFYFFLHGMVDAPIFKNDLLILFLGILWMKESLNEGSVARFLDFARDDKKGDRDDKTRKRFLLLFTGIYFFTNALIMFFPRESFAFAITKFMGKEMVYYDVYEGSKYFEEIKKVKEQGFMPPFKDFTFRAEQTMNRAEFLQIMINYKKIQIENNFDEKCFSDIEISSEYHNLFCTGKKYGFIEGDVDLKARPDWRISKSEAFKIFAKVLNWPINQTQFDKNNIDEWYRPYVEFVINNNLIDYDWEKFEMWDPITRGEVVEVVIRNQRSAIRNEMHHS
ncbi:MAG: Cellulosome-anchoring protein [Candidatus Peregrinibacteria bacterium GW2011_GWA2_33_10]|nr:MAG: Cellulosome-anchoring protein [Candidatus Peregrinibacteria bacterium GW2011_GWA2_33_10]KKP38868.1 MAG: Cellulosome-anchoring protein [Candidatus Peregrinibacteria bacterium GW2011_GWC2_33_13]